MVFVDFFIGIINGVTDLLFNFRFFGISFLQVIIAYIFLRFVIGFIRG